MKCFFGLIVFTCVCIASVSCDTRPSGERRLRAALETGNTNYLQQYLTSGGNLNQSIQVDPHMPVTAPLLHVAVEFGQREVVQWLLQNGANPNLPDSKGKTALFWSVGRYEPGVSSETRVQILEALLQAGADPNAKEKSEAGETPLCLAARRGEASMVSVLLKAGASVNGTDNDGLTALHFAENPETALLLIGAGANPQAQSAGETPTDTARRLGHFGVLSVLTNVPAQTNQPKQ